MNSYVHIPFCDRKCKYCRFASLWKVQNLFIKKYLSFLLKEIKNYSGKKNKLKTIYFGGWTPSTLDYAGLEKIITCLKNKFNIKKNAEITLETTPDKVDLKNLISWEKIWINRVSIWIQTLNKKSLKEISRWNNKTIFECLDEIKNYINKKTADNSLSKKEKKYINNFSLDFIIWLPYTKKWETKKNIEKILKKYNFIKHISVYLLEDYLEIRKEIEEKNNFEKITYPKSWKKNSLKEKEYLGEYLEVQKFLKNKWFCKYEISNFSKKGFECKHNKGYWKHKKTVWFWLSASGFVKNSKWKLLRYSNSSNFTEYYSKKLEEKYFLKKEDIFLEKVMFWLRTSWIKKNIYKKLNLKKIKDFINLWFLEKKQKKLILKNKWILVLDYIIKEIL